MLSLSLTGGARSYENLDSASQLNVNLTIPLPNNVHDFQVLGVHSFRNDRTLARINLTSTLLVPPYFGRQGNSFRSSLAL